MQIRSARRSPSIANPRVRRRTRSAVLVVAAAADAGVASVPRQAGQRYDTVCCGGTSPGTDAAYVGAAATGAGASTPSLSDEAQLVLCANASVPLDEAPAIDHGGPRFLLMQLATPNLWSSFCGYTAALNAAWAKRHGHRYMVTPGEYLARKDLWRGGNVRAVLQVVRVLGPSSSRRDWIFHLDCDAAIVDAKGKDALAGAVASYALADTEVLLSRDETGFAGGSRLTNLGTGLWRRSRWTKHFLEEFWGELESNPELVEQEVLERFLQRDMLGCQSRIVLLPAGFLNSESANPIAAPSSRQPVVHLAGMPDEVRVRVFQTAWAKQCLFKAGADETGWELRDVLLESLRSHVKKLPDEPPPPKDDEPALGWTDVSHAARVTRRLALSLLQGGRHRDEAASMFRLALHRSLLLERSSALAKLGAEADEAMAIMLESFVAPLMELGHKDEAQELLMRPRPATLGPRHEFDELVRLENTAALMQGDGRLEEASAFARRALRGFEVAFPASSRDTRPASARARLAQILHLRGLYDEAEPLLRSALKRFEASLGTEHPQVMSCARNLAVLLKQLPGARRIHVLPEAEALLQRAADGYLATLGLDHPDTQRAERNLQNFRLWLAKQNISPSAAAAQPPKAAVQSKPTRRQRTASRDNEL